jgi:hypothetical protein
MISDILHVFSSVRIVMFPKLIEITCFSLDFDHRSRASLSLSLSLSLSPLTFSPMKASGLP